MAYRTLGSRGPQYGAADPSNPIAANNWTVSFPPQILNVNVPEFEVYKAILKGAATSATFDVYLNGNLWDTNIYAAQNTWSARNPLITRPGDTLYFYYSSPSTDGSKPVITLWMRYDVSLTELFPQ